MIFPQSLKFSISIYHYTMALEEALQVLQVTNEKGFYIFDKAVCRSTLDEKSMA